MAQSFYSQSSPYEVSRYEVSRYEISLIITFKIKYVISAWIVTGRHSICQLETPLKHLVPSYHSRQEGETEGKINTNCSTVVCMKLFGCF
jgi:hypothetical protein